MKKWILALMAVFSISQMGWMSLASAEEGASPSAMEGEHANKEEAAEVKKTSHKPGGHHNKHRKKHHKEDNAEKEG